MNASPWTSRRFVVALAAMGILFALLVAASVRLLITESELSDDVTEDMVWLASQTQYEAVRFADALSTFASGRLLRDEVQLRLDLLTSRIAVLEQGEPHRQMETLGYAAQVDDFRRALDAAHRRVAGLSPDQTEEVASLRNDVLPIAQAMRDVANAALLARRDRDAQMRELRRSALFQVLATLVATMLAGLVVSVIVVRDQRNIANAQAALERERQVSRLHRAFISVVSHQFRTPLAIIDASAQRMMRRGALMAPDEIAARAEKIRNACLRLTRLMESTINAARMEEGEINFRPRPCNLADLLREVCESQQEPDQDRIELELMEIREWIEVDSTLLEQAVQNLVSNALKYSPADAPVTIRAWRADSQVLISVSDKGVGIPADELDSLFGRFFRARTAQGVPGTGIGLSFVAQIMALHDGRVDVESVEGEGSTFTLRFPFRAAGAAHPDLPTPARQPMAQSS